MKKILGLLLLLLSPALAEAQSSYTFRSGYYWYPGISYPYTRSYVNACYVNGCYQAGYYLYYPQTQYVAPTPPVVEDKWAILAKGMADIKEKETFIAAIQASGLTSKLVPQLAPYLSVGLPGYGGSYGQSYQANYYGANASTIYGADLKQQSQAYNNELTYMQADASLISQQQGLLGQRNQLFQQNVGKALDRSAAVQQIYAKGMVEVEKIKAALMTPDKSVTVQSYGQNPDVLPQPQVIGQAQPSSSTTVVNSQSKVTDVGNALLGMWAASAQNCVGCHSGKESKAGYDITQWPSMPYAQQKLAVDRMRLPPNDPKGMPQAKDAQSAHRLSEAEIKGWELNYNAK